MGLPDGRLAIMSAPRLAIRLPTPNQPQTNSKYQFVNALYSALPLFETTNRVLQLVENTLFASLITQRSLVQIQPPQPIKVNIINSLQNTISHAQAVGSKIQSIYHFSSW